MYDICSKLTIKTPEQRKWCRLEYSQITLLSANSVMIVRGVFKVYEQIIISHF